MCSLSHLFEFFTPFLTPLSVFWLFHVGFKSHLPVPTSSENIEGVPDTEKKIMPPKSAISTKISGPKRAREGDEVEAPLISSKTAACPTTLEPPPSDENFVTPNFVPDDVSLASLTDPLPPEVDARIYGPLRYFLASFTKDGTVEGVPYCPRVGAFEKTMEHLRNMPRTASRHDLLCNTGASGTGKSVQLAQDMKTAALFGCVVFSVDFNGLQELSVDKDKATSRHETLKLSNFISVRVLSSVLGIVWGENVHEKVNTELPKRGYETSLWGLSLEEAVVIAKEIAGCADRPAFLAIDEFKKIGDWSSLDALDSLSKLCGVMDRSMFQSPKDRIYLSVSVYDMVDLRNLQANSKRKLLHQPLPPVLPFIFNGSLVGLDPKGWPRHLLDPALRNHVPMKYQGNVARGVKLLFRSGGHGRCLESLLRCAGGTPISALGESEFSLAQREMSAALDTSRIVPILEKHFSTNELLDLLKGLFVLSPREGDTLTAATPYHYQVFPAFSHRKVGFLWLDAASKLVESLAKEAAAQQDELFNHIVEVFSVLNSPTRSFSAGKQFEEVLFRSLPISFCSNASEEIRHFFYQLGSQIGEAPIMKPTGILFKTDVPAFPVTNANIEVLEDIAKKINGERPATGPKTNASDLLECQEQLIDDLLSVGSGGNNTALSVLPEYEYSLAADHLLAIPLEGGGRVVFVFQEKEWFFDTVKDSRKYCVAEARKHCVTEARWGRQFFLCDKCYSNREGKGGTHVNRFYQAWKDRIQRKGGESVVGPTHFVFVLATPNCIDTAAQSTGIGKTPESETEGNLGDCSGPLDDEAWLSLEHMGQWCPTVAYSALAGDKFRGILRGKGNPGYAFSSKDEG